MITLLLRQNKILLYPKMLKLLGEIFGNEFVGSKFKEKIKSH